MKIKAAPNFINGLLVAFALVSGMVIGLWAIAFYLPTLGWSWKWFDQYGTWLADITY